MKSPWTRAGVAIAVVGTLTITIAGPAWAEEPGDDGYGGLFGAGDGYILNTPGGELMANTTAVYSEEETGVKARTYRLDTIPVPDSDEVAYGQQTWDDTSIGNLGRANWIIRNSYPTVDAATLAGSAGADLSGVADPGMVAHTATQAAIWVLTSELKLDPQDPTAEDDAVDAAVLDITDYLIEENERLAEPANELTIEGKPSWDGERLGPFHFAGVDDDGWAMATKVDSGYEAGKVVAGNGDELSHLDPGQKFYVVPDKGIEKLEVRGIAKDSPEAGTLMQTEDEGEPTLMLAEDAGYGVTAAREVTIGADADGRLPVTGTSLTGVMGAGALLLLLGGTVILFVMRRKPTDAV